MIGSAKGEIANIVVKNKGIYPIVPHSLKNALRGAIALLNVSDEPKDLTLMPSIAPKPLEKTARVN